MDINSKIKQIDILFFHKNIKMNIYDYEYYKNDDGEGKDIISECFEKKYCWEPYQCELAKEILEYGNNLCIDIGSHLGTYSIISSIFGNRTISIERNKNVNNIFRKTIQDNDLLKLDILDMSVNKHTKIEDIVKEDYIRLLKVDVCGAEDIVYSIFKSKFEAKEIDYAIFEITSKHVERYKFIEELHKMGYKIFNIGLSKERQLENDTDHLYSEDLKKCEIIGDFEETIKNLDKGQSNFLCKSNQIMNEKCTCGADINHFSKN